MADQSDHAACVDAWMERAPQGKPSEQLIRAFERGFAALWGRAHQTLGSVTLSAITDRVLYAVAERYPGFSVLQIDADGLHSQALRENVGNVEPAELAEGLRFALVEFLTVLGNLTAEILTPSLHAELDAVAPDESSSGDPMPRGGPPNPLPDNGRGAKS